MAKKNSTQCQRDSTSTLLRKWADRVQADNATRTPSNRIARLKMRSIERVAGVTHRDLTIKSEQLAIAIKRNEVNLAVNLGHEIVDIDYRLHAAAKKIGVDIAFLRIEVTDAKTNTNRSLA